MKLDPFSFRTSLVFLGMFFFGLAFPDMSSAQIKASERSTLMQTVDGTVITIEYSRPSRRGRDPIFGGFVYWGEVWTPGADRATTIEFSNGVTIDDNEVSAGKYSLWMAVNDGDWEVALSKKANLFHVPHLVLNDDQIRFFVKPRQHAAEMETLTFLYPEVRADGAVLRMHWGSTFVDMNIGVESTQRLRVTAEEAAPYVGKYATRVEPNPQVSLGVVNFELELSYENDFLGGEFDLGWPEGPLSTSLAPVTDQVFHPVQMMNGLPAGVIDVVYFEFEMGADGRAIRFEARNKDDELWMSGTRID